MLALLEGRVVDALLLDGRVVYELLGRLLTVGRLLVVGLLTLPFVVVLGRTEELLLTVGRPEVLPLLTLALALLDMLPLPLGV